jgi:hypothetical protein
MTEQKLGVIVFIALGILFLVSSLSFAFPIPQVYAQETPIASYWANRYTYQIDYAGGISRSIHHIAPQAFWNNESSQWQDLLLEAHTGAAKPYYLLRNAHITAKVGLYKGDDAVLYFDPDYTRKVCAEFWTPQAYIGGSWESLDTTFYDDNVFANSTYLNVTGVFKVWYGVNHVGWMRISYILKPASFLKHEVVYKNISPQTRDVRAVMTLIGVAGKKVIHTLGEHTVTLNETQIMSRRLRFVNATNPEFQFLEERLDSLGHWENGAWVNDYLKTIRLKLVEYEGKQLVRCDIVIGNYTLASGESLSIDPDTNTWQVGQSSDDCDVADDESSHPPWDSIDLVSYYNTAGHWSSTAWQGSGMRFTSINVPNGATISSAYLKLYADYQQPGSGTNTRIACHNTDNAATFSTISDYNSRSRTSYVSWMNIPNWNPSQWHTSPNIGSCVQIVVNRVGWASGNAMVVFWEDDGTSSVGAYRASTSYDNQPNYAPKLEITWVSNSAPTNDQCIITDMDDTDNLYAQKGWYTIDYDVSDPDGFVDIDYAEVRFRQGAALRATFRYDEDTNIFSIQSGTTWELDTGSSSATESSTYINMTFKIKPRWNATEEVDLEIECYVTDDEPASDTETMQTDYFDVVTDLVTTFSIDDDRGNIGQPITASGTITYSGSSLYPPDTEFTSVSVYDSSNNNEGPDTTIVNGTWSVTFTTPSTAGTDTYNLYIDMADTDYTDGEETTPTDTFITDGLKLTGLTSPMFLGNGQYQYQVQITYAYDDSSINSGVVRVKKPDGTELTTDYTANSTGWATIVLTQTNATSGTWTLFGHSEPNYGITYTHTNQTFQMWSLSLNPKDNDGNVLGNTSLKVYNGSTLVLEPIVGSAATYPETSYTIKVYWLENILVNQTNNYSLTTDTNLNLNCTAYPFTLSGTRYHVASNITISSASWTSSTSKMEVTFTGSAGTYVLVSSDTTEPTYVLNCTYDVDADFGTYLILSHDGSKKITVGYPNWATTRIHRTDHILTQAYWAAEGEKLVITLSGTSGQSGTLEVYCGSRSTPESTTGLTGASYSTSTTIITGTYTFSSTTTVEVSWSPQNQGSTGPSQTTVPPVFVTAEGINAGSIQQGLSKRVNITITWAGSRTIMITDMTFSGLGKDWLNTDFDLPTIAERPMRETSGVIKIPVLINVPSQAEIGNYKVLVAYAFRVGTQIYTTSANVLWSVSATSVVPTGPIPEVVSLIMIISLLGIGIFAIARKK